MKQVEFVGAYTVDFFSKYADELCTTDPIALYRDLSNIRAAYGPLQHNEEAAEQPMELSMKYKDEDDFKIKGRSFWLFQMFMESLIAWTFTREGETSHAEQDIRRLIDWVIDTIEYDDVEFDTDITFKIKTEGSGAFTITVSGGVMASTSWSQTIFVTM